MVRNVLLVIIRQIIEFIIQVQKYVIVLLGFIIMDRTNYACPVCILVIHVLLVQVIAYHVMIIRLIES